MDWILLWFIPILLFISSILMYLFDKNTDLSLFLYTTIGIEGFSYILNQLVPIEPKEIVSAIILAILLVTVLLFVIISIQSKPENNCLPVFKNTNTF